MIAALALALYWHLTRVSTMKQSTAASIAVLLPVVAIGATTWTSMRDQDRNVNFIDAHLKLYPPAWRLREGGTVDVYFTAAARLRDSADRRRKALPEGDDTGEEE
jgi:hypothetical protein